MLPVTIFVTCICFLFSFLVLSYILILCLISLLFYIFSFPFVDFWYLFILLLYSFSAIFLFSKASLSLFPVCCFFYFCFFCLFLIQICTFQVDICQELSDLFILQKRFFVSFPWTLFATSSFVLLRFCGLFRKLFPSQEAFPLFSPSYPRGLLLPYVPPCLIK